MRVAVLSALVLSSISAISPAIAQNPPLGALATNIPGIYTFPAPPDDFDATSATDYDLQRYGLPTRPKPGQSPKAYSDWVRRFGGHKQRVVPVLVQTDRKHGPNKPGIAVANSARSLTNAGETSLNWSGVADGSPATTFGDPNSVNYVNAMINVPIAQQAFGTCVRSPVYASEWIGIDGLTNNDVLQTGLEADALSCAGGSTASQYYAWLEWYPNAEVAISNFPLIPGQALNRYIVATSSTTANVYLDNYSANVTLTPIAITAPPPLEHNLSGTARNGLLSGQIQAAFSRISRIM